MFHKPTEVILEIVKGEIRLIATMPTLPLGKTCIESVKFMNGSSLPGLRKHATKYAKQWNIKFIDKTI